jgi:hypothetical protein
VDENFQKVSMLRVTSPSKKIFSEGQLVTADFDNAYMLTYSRAPIETTIPNDVRFYSGDIGLVITKIDMPDSFYTSGYAMILIPQGKGWVPFRWLKPLY